MLCGIVVSVGRCLETQVRLHDKWRHFEIDVALKRLEKDGCYGIMDIFSRMESGSFDVAKLMIYVSFLSL